MQPGHRVIVSELAEDPMEALARFVHLEPQPAPDPSTLGARDVVVAIRAASVNWVDLLMTSGQYQHMAKPPYTPGLEYAGEIAWAGPESGKQVGARVLVDGLSVGPRSLGAYQKWGGYASYGVAPAEAIHPLPGGLGFDEACNLLGNCETAYHALIARGRVQAGEVVLVHGASGSTGLAAVQMAKLLGATVIATGRSDEKLAIVKAHGADHVVNTTELAVLRDAVKALTGGKGVDVVYDGVGGDISVESLRCVKFGARYLICGWAATPFVSRGKGQRGAPNANVLPTNLIMMKGLDVLGCPAAISVAQDPSIRAERFARVWAWAEAGQLRPLVTRTAPLADFKAVMLAKWRGEIVGNAALHP